MDKRRDTLASTRMWLTQNLEGLRPDPLATLVKRVKNDRTRSDALTQLKMIHGALKMIPAMSGQLSEEELTLAQRLEPLASTFDELDELHADEEEVMMKIEAADERLMDFLLLA